MKRNSKQLVLDAAMRVFAERGFYGARVTDITEASGVNVRIIYHHFSSKEHLYEEVLRTALDKLVNEPVPSSSFATNLLAWEAASNWEAAKRIFDDAEMRVFVFGGRMGEPTERAAAWGQAMTERTGRSAALRTPAATTVLGA